MQLSLYDSLSRRTAPVEPRDAGRLAVYVCGPTVYGFIHVGNARPFWLGQVLKRFAERRLGLAVELVVNITDVNDKIYAAARETGEPSDRLAQRYTAAYVADTSRLGLGRPDVEPLASESVPGIVSLIETLCERGLAYESDGDVYFDVGSFPGYGALSHQRTDELIASARVEPGERKRSALDFALWKATKPDEDTSWNSPWGAGRPGWHIECSAMALEHLGTGFDVHGGGLDLIFPHHENERAQSEGAGAAPFVRRWMHNGMLRLRSEKMSKSLGNIERLRDALDRWGPETLCMYFARAHYRSPVDYDDDVLEQARAAADTLREALRSARRYARERPVASTDPSPAAPSARADAFDEALCRDLDTPAALAVIHGWARDLNVAATGGGADAAEVSAAADALVACLDVLGLAGLDAGPAEAPAAVAELAARREHARAERDFARADALRAEIAEHGWLVRDTPQGQELLPGEL
jgi:cysteinyl-tRNA synthetase